MQAHLGTASHICAAAALLVAGIAPPSVASAQGAGTGKIAPDGSVILLRDVPARSAIEPGRPGDATWVETSPNHAFDNALELGVGVLDDAQAANVRSSVALSPPVADLIAHQAVDQTINNAVSAVGLMGADVAGTGAAGSSMRGSLDAGLAAAGAGINQGLGALGSAFGNVKGMGQ